MIVQITKDAIPFTLVLLMFLCGMTIISISRQIHDPEEDKEIHAVDIFLSMYRLAFGDTDDDYKESDDWIMVGIFFLGSFIFSLIMLNMIIAVMGDTYA